MKTELVVSDPHVPYHDRRAWKLFLKLGKVIDPDIIYLLGDIIDFYPISFWMTDPSRMGTLQKELDQTQEILDELRDTFHKATIYYRPGNHEYRLQRHIWQHAPRLSSLRSLNLWELLGVKKLHITPVDGGRYRKPHQIGKLFHVHGDEIRMPWSSQNVARNAYLRVNANLIMGHYHRFQQHTQTDIKRQEHGVWVNGCLCQKDVEYDPIPNQQQGVTLVTYTQRGFFHVQPIPFFNQRTLFEGREYVA